MAERKHQKRTTDEHGFEVFVKGHGKKLDQKMKPYLVLQYWSYSLLK